MEEENEDSDTEEAKVVQNLAKLNMEEEDNKKE